MMVVIITKLMNKQIHVQILNLNVELMGNGNIGNARTYLFLFRVNTFWQLVGKLVFQIIRWERLKTFHTVPSVLLLENHIKRTF